ncbi:MAG TPA: hypothetical protein PK303_07020 [bacterium]|nr:hypothetical protein [bacterium]HOL35333.1 hypothetical protein [bacterium]HPP08853.1 hypothetical protein [bacterium]
MKKCILFITFYFFSLLFCFAETAKNQNFSPQNIANKNEIIDLINKFAIKDAKEGKQNEAILEIIKKYGFSALPYLLEGLGNENDEIKYYSLQSIGEILSTEIVKRGGSPNKASDFRELSFSEEEKEILEKIYQTLLFLLNSSNSKVRKRTVWPLSLLGRKDSIPFIEKLLNDNDIEIRYNALINLKRFGVNYNGFKVLAGKEPKTPEEYAEFLDYMQYGLSVKAMDELRKFEKKAIPVLLKVAKEGNYYARVNALQLLIEMEAEEAIPIFANYLNVDEYIVKLSVYGLSKIDTEESIKILKEYGLKHPNLEIELLTAETLLKTDEEKIKPFLIEMAETIEDCNIKLRIANILKENRKKECIPIYIELLSDLKYFNTAKNYLEDITKQRFGDIPPVVSKKKLEQYIEKWKSWWENNKDTFKFPEEQN